MAKRDHEPIKFTSFKGLYRRNDRAVPPLGYLTEAENIVFSPMLVSSLVSHKQCAFRTRERLENSTVFPTAALRYYVYEKATGNRYIMLSAAGNFVDVTAGTTILTIAGCTDFHGITINDRFYFTPHDGTTGLSGEVVYVYDPSLAATARAAAGLAPVGVFTVAVSATAGNIEPGMHVIAVSYETNTGHRTKPALHQTFTAPTPRMMVNLTAVPIGPAHIAKRLIWMSRVVREYDGNITAVPLYLVYTIADNVTTVLANTVNAFDSQLISSADPYTDALETIPAGTFLTNLDGRMVICGAFADAYVIRASNINEPEAVDAVDGINEVMRGDGGGVRTTRAYNGNLIWWKPYRTGRLLNNGTLFAEWPKEVIDTTLGSSVYGVSEALNQPTPFFDVHLVANASGLFVFNGTYINVLKPLSWVIENLWRFWYVADLSKSVKITVDPICYRIYCILPLPPTEILVADFSEGLNWDTIKWSTWKFSYDLGVGRKPIDMHVFPAPGGVDSGSYLSIVHGGEATSKLVKTNYDNAIIGDATHGHFPVEFALRIIDEELRYLHLNSVKLLAAASGGSIDKFKITVTKPVTTDDIITNEITSQFFTLTAAQLRVIEEVFNITGAAELEVNISKTDDDVADIIVNLIELFVEAVYQETS